MEQLKLAALGLAFFAGIFDVFTARIPNWLSFPGMVLGLLAQVFWGAPLQGLLGLLLGFSVFIPLFATRIMGGGDVKLLMMIGSFTAPLFTLYVAIASILVGGVYALVDTLLRGRLVILASALVGAARGLLRKSEAMQMIDKQRKFSFGLAIALGFAFVMAFEKWELLP